MTQIANAAIKRSVERKYFDSNQAAALTTAGVMIDLSDIPQGSSDFTRVGDEVQWVDLQVSGILNTAADGETTPIPVYTRVIVFQYMPSTAASFPIIAELLQLSSGLAVFAPQQWDQRTNYHILSDRTWPISNVGDNAANFFRFVIRQSGRGRRKVRFNSGSINGEQHLFALLVSDQGTGGFNPSINVTFRLTYMDA
jgi:hypothetical protein